MSTLTMIVLSGVVGLVIGLIAGRFIDPVRKQGHQKATTLKQAQKELDNVRTQITEHFKQTSSGLQQLRDNAKTLHSQLVSDAARIGGINLEGIEELGDSQKLARLLTGDATLPPRDYAPKSDNTPGTLSEEYGLRDDDDDYLHKSA